MNCDLPYWFDVNVVANGTKALAVNSNFNVFCKDDAIFVRINGEKVCEIVCFYLSSMVYFWKLQDLIGTLFAISVVNHATSAVVAQWQFRNVIQSCPQAVFPSSFTSFAVSR